jgi:polyhydroxyalkanoate synthesis repressor PhaR
MNHETPSSEPLRVELRRYPNRRYYDCARSQHLTLDDIYRLVREGHSVTISDSKTGEDISARVLTQLILEHDAAKLAAFPAELLHQIIRSNESLLREFVEKYFSRALTAFLKSQREFEHYLRQTLGLYSSAPLLGRGWTEMMLAPLMRAFPHRNGEIAITPEDPAAESGAGRQGGLRQAVEDLQRELTALREELEQR